MKNPTVATLLNVIPGLGYLYLGRKKPFAILLLAATTLNLFAVIFYPITAEYQGMSPTVWDWAVMITFVLFEAAFMYDAHHEAMLAQKEASRKK